MPDFSRLSDADLDTKIAKYEAVIEDVELNGGVGKVQGEGRLVEYVQANVSSARNTLEELYFERRKRTAALTGLPCGRAIPVRILP